MHGMSPPAHLRSSAGLLHLYFDFNCRDLFSSFSFSFFSNSRGKTAGDSREYDVLEKIFCDTSLRAEICIVNVLEYCVEP